MRTPLLLIIVAVLAAAVSCKQESPRTDTKESVLSLADPLTFGNLTIYPVLANAALVEQHAALAGIKTLADVMDTPGFRITEPKQFGREEGAWYNSLTLVNKTTDTVYMMSGDVVTGGNQDRVNGENLMALPGTIRNIPVFCVEQGRSSYYDPGASVEERKLAAFRGYYSVASPRVRKAVSAGDQEDVWGAVAAITDAHQATSATKTYAALEQENAAKQKRDACIAHFEAAWKGHPAMVGMVAVCNQKAIGGEVFAHPQLFQRKMKALLHSYAVESGMSTTTVPVLNNQPAENVLKSLQSAALSGSNAAAGRFDFGGAWLHVYLK